MTVYEKLTLALSGGALFVSVGAAVGGAIWAGVVSRRETQSQLKLERSVHASEKLLAQRQMFLQLWPHFSTLSAINPAAPVLVDVVKALNALELVSICWEAEAVDRDLIRRSFAQGYMKMHDDISRTGALPNGKDGPQMLRESPSVGRLHDALRHEHQNAGAIAPLSNP